MQQTISPAIFYWGTPVVLITTENEDGTFNIAPMSSAFWLGNRCMLGLSNASHTTANLLRTKQCVLNLPSDNMKDAVNALARTTGTPQACLSDFKRTNGYKHVHDKFLHAGLTPIPSDCIRPARIAECPAQMEAELIGVHEMFKDTGLQAPFALEVKVVRTHVHDCIRMAGHRNRIDPDLWHPMIMSFQQLYGLHPHKLVESKLAKIPEEAYRRLANPIDDNDVDVAEEQPALPLTSSQA